MRRAKRRGSRAIWAGWRRCCCGPKLGDVNVHERFEMDVQPRAEGAVTVIGVLALSADWDE